MSFQGMGKSIVPMLFQNRSEVDFAPVHRSDEFAAGYSSTGCSPAEPVSASPAELILRD
jgi:hypothetical protein